MKNLSVLQLRDLCYGKNGKVSVQYLHQCIKRMTKKPGMFGGSYVFSPAQAKRFQETFFKKESLTK